MQNNRRWKIITSATMIGTAAPSGVRLLTGNELEITAIYEPNVTTLIAKPNRRKVDANSKNPMAQHEKWKGKRK